MRTSLFASVALAALVSAATIPGLPSCTSNCISTDFGGCGSLDIPCICSNKSLISGLACCVSTACSKTDQDATLQFANAICAGQGVTDLPQTATCASSASATASASASGTTSSGSATATTTTGSGSGSASAAASTSGTATGTATSASSTGVVASATSRASSATSAVASATSTGAAGRMEAAAFGAGALVFGVLAAL